MFTYTYGANPPIDYPRLLVSDTVQFAPDGTTRVYAFEDAEIEAATRIEMAVWQSAQFYSGAAGEFTLSSVPVPWRRIAATLLDSLASNQARMQIIVRLLDVYLNPNASKEMREQAKALRQADDDTGAFFIAEVVNDQFSFRDRWWNVAQRRQL